KVAGGRACVNLAMVRGGRHLGDRPYFPVHVEEATGVFQLETREDAPDNLMVEEAGGLEQSVPAQILAAFIAQHYLGVPLPPTLITSEPVDPALLWVLAQQTGVRATVVHQPREQRRIWLEMAEQNAQIQ
ncbi:hypothetical protein KZW07_31320, partial [Klebsiella pneumoniae]|nr:hypothetical protein [Klebsiella pneumoniae]